MRSVFFDVDGVLLHGYHARPERQVRWDENLLNDLGIDPERFSTEFIYGPFVKHVLPGRMSLIEALDRVLPSLGYRGSSMRLVHYWLSHDSVVNTEMLDVVRRLKQVGDCKLYIATNQDHMRALWLWQQLGMSELFDDIFYAARLGAAKPNQPFFDEIAKRVGPQSEPPLFFDDVEKVVAAARRNGWEAVLFDTLPDCTGHPWIAERLKAA